MNSTSVHGCAPTPLASYLKALGILRLVAEQADSQAVGAWKGNTFTLTSKLDREALLSFFLQNYQPTPIIAPWNGGSGFFPKDNKDGIGPIREAKSPRLVSFQNAIAAADACLTELSLTEKPEKDVKERLLTLCRNRSPEELLEWIDSAFVLTGDGAKYPPLLGTGGNDGRLEFTNNFMQRLTEVFDLPSGEPAKASPGWLENALFGTVLPVLVRGGIGQFSPAAGGGANASTGFDGHSATNPWDFILMLEGAILFAGAAVKRLESTDVGQLVYPFCVRQAGVGYGSATLSDETNSRCEMWLPLWDQPAGLSELKALLSEGRAQVAGRAARNGVDFARAVATLGVDRGIGAFQRYGFQVRNGLAYFATPLERVIVRRNQLASQLLGPLDDWLNRFRGKALGESAPASVQRASRRVDAAIVAFCKAADPARVQELLIALGEAEAALATSWNWTRENLPQCMPLLEPRWILEASKGVHTRHTEFRLAAALASTLAGDGVPSLRCHLECIELCGGGERRWAKWTEIASNDVVWHEGPFEDMLNAILSRRILLAEKAGAKSFPDRARISARLGDVAEFIEGRTDPRILVQLLWGLSLVNFGEDSEFFRIQGPTERRSPSALYALLKLCFTRHTVRDVKIPLIPAIHQRARAGDGFAASSLAARRLRASGVAPAVESIAAYGPVVKRTAAALLFSITQDDLEAISERVLRPTQAEAKPKLPTYEPDSTRQ